MKEKVKCMKFVKFSFKWSIQSHKCILRKKSGNRWLKRNSYWKASLLRGCVRRQQKKVGKKFKGCPNVRKYCFFSLETDRHHTWVSFLASWHWSLALATVGNIRIEKAFSSISYLYHVLTLRFFVKFVSWVFSSNIYRPTKWPRKQKM